MWVARSCLTCALVLLASTTLAQDDPKTDETGCLNLCRMTPVEDCGAASNCKNSLIVLEDGRIRPCGAYKWGCSVFQEGAKWWNDIWACNQIDGEKPTLDSVKAYCNEACYRDEGGLVQYQCPIGAIASLDPTQPGAPVVNDWFDKSLWQPFGGSAARRKYRWGQEPDMNERGRREACLNMCSKAWPGKCIYQGCRRGLDIMGSCKEQFTWPTAHNNGEGFTTCAHTHNGSCHKEVRKEWKCHKINGEVATLDALWRLCDGKCYNWGADENGNHETPCAADAFAALPDPAITSWDTLERMNSQKAKTACPGEDPLPVEQPTDPPAEAPTKPPAELPTMPPVEPPAMPPVQLPTKPPVTDEPAAPSSRCAAFTGPTKCANQGCVWNKELGKGKQCVEGEAQPECSQADKMDKCGEMNGCTWADNQCVAEDKEQTNETMKECLKNKYYKKGTAKQIKKGRKQATTVRTKSTKQVDKLTKNIGKVKSQIAKNQKKGKSVTKQENKLRQFETNLQKQQEKLAPAVFFLENCDPEA